MKVTKIGCGMSGVIAIASYENLRPSFTMEIELGPKDDVRKVFQRASDYMHEMMDNEAYRGKVEYLKRARDGFRWHTKNGKDYISVTTVLGWDMDWHVKPDHLAQLAARGTIVGEMVEIFFSTGQWIDPEESENLAEDVALLKSGSSGLSWNDCSHVAFCEQFAKDIKVEQTQLEVFNDEHMYAGTLDILGKYQGHKAVLDCKCGGYDFAQLAAYAVCIPSVTHLVVLPVGPTDNKCGYKKPIVCEDIKGEFEKFLQARTKFRRSFGI